MRQECGITARQLQLARRADAREQHEVLTPRPAIATTSDAAAAITQRPSLPLPRAPPSPGAMSSMNVVLNSTQLRSLFSNMICSKCMQNVEVDLTNKWIDSECSVSCSCETPGTAAPPTVSSSGRKYSKDNLSLVLYSICNNLGYRGVQTLAGALERPVMHSYAFEQHAQYLYDQMDVHFPRIQTRVYYQEFGGRLRRISTLGYTEFALCLR